jgi:hypothetical protein
LIVEDNSKYVTLKTILKNDPIKSNHEAINGLEAVKKFEKHSIDIILWIYKYLS